MAESGSQGKNNPLLQSLDDDFQALQRHFADQLTQDIDYLKTEKQRLIGDLEALRVEYDELYLDYQSLKSELDVTLSKQQLAQQNAWAKRLAQVLAHNLREDLHAYVTNSVDLPNPTQDWLHSLDDTLNRSVKSLQHDLSSYQSAIAQQLTRMQTMEQQGEVILESLVARLSSQLGDQLAPAPNGSAPLPPALDNRPLLDGSSVVGGRTYVEQPRPDQVVGTTRRVVPPYEGNTLQPALGAMQLSKTAKPRSAGRDRTPGRALKKGMVLCGIATLGLSAIPFLVGGLSLGTNLFGETLLGGALAGLPGFNFFDANTLLLLQLVVLIPVLAVLAPSLYPSVWRDVGQTLRAPTRWFPLVGGAVFYFFAQVLLFQAVGNLGPAAAAPLMFAYPLLAVPLMWWLRGDRPNLLRGVVMLAIAMGVVLILRPLAIATASAALLSAVAFALYVVINSLSRQSHPIVTGIIQYGIMAILSGLILLIRPFVVTQQVLTSQFVGVGLGLGLLAAVSQFFHYSGLRLVGGLRTALIAAATPLVTALLAVFLLTNQPTIQMIQWPGIILITLGGMTLALDRLSRQKTA
ncbi:DMT family transporter [Leptothoe sp. PORK10 BA2]|uniref:DMT family transporter n=1 Tax=Leptothoe sp. PORK10 BA2 TaxID=3110254 RepID=UPI002B1F0EBC|nr:EamA family transporter [Leptothoe sp. PORK10 BA2]MEA5466203.1 EamA family transporter [Leptothoe sp. PORK10 BA2]